MSHVVLHSSTGDTGASMMELRVGQGCCGVLYCTCLRGAAIGLKQLTQSRPTIATKAAKPRTPAPVSAKPFARMPG
ncbi:hypothetical protein VTN77DRAFT_3734 [Rasamsonia byssochlamydoides]|uniref:uncharacterized protein n=1 Tax=Rasamsonia byssochlamydoides TaxID=89139 RepID=UPI003744A5CC